MYVQPFSGAWKTEISVVLFLFRSPSLIRYTSQQPNRMEEMVLSENKSVQFLTFALVVCFTKAVSVFPSPLKSPVMRCPTVKDFCEKQRVIKNKAIVVNSKYLMLIILYIK